MAKGIIYVMTTIVPGLIKIGKTGSDNFEQRMYILENNGYKNVVGLKRRFAIEVDDYDAKEALLDSMFSKSQIGKTELFALDVDTVVELLSSFEGKQVYPTNVTKENVFIEAESKRGTGLVPNDIYYLERKIKRWNNRLVKGKMKVEDGKFIVLSGSTVCPIQGEGLVKNGQIIKKQQKSRIENNILKEDVVFTSPSLAAAFLISGPTDGWIDWKTQSGDSIDKFRK